MISLDTNDRTAPTHLWNAYHQARRNPEALKDLHNQGVTSDILRNWAHHPDKHEAAIAALENH